MNDVEQKLEELRIAWKTANELQRHEIEQEAELYKCCVLVGPVDKKVRCNKPVATMRGVVCKDHLEQNHDPIKRKPRTIEEIQQRLNDPKWRLEYKNN